jgi:hypothetical protein
VAPAVAAIETGVPLNTSRADRNVIVAEPAANVWVCVTVTTTETDDASSMV